MAGAAAAARIRSNSAARKHQCGQKNRGASASRRLQEGTVKYIERLLLDDRNGLSILASQRTALML